jgi:hypothetical protein
MVGARDEVTRGGDIATAVVEPEALAVLQHSDSTVVHRDVLLHV